jgi:hypothetical protein
MMPAADRITLAKPIVGLQLEATRDGVYRMGLLSQLPTGAELLICGEGFNERTAKVRCHEHYYFVFLQDIQRFESGRE